MVTKNTAETPDVWAQPVGPASERDFLTVSLKGGGGYEVPWGVFHFNSVDEAFDTLAGPGEYEDRTIDQLFELIAAKSKAFQKANGGSQSAPKPASSGGWSKGGSKAPAAPQAASGNLPQAQCPKHNADLVFADTFVNPKTKKTVNAKMGCPVPGCYDATIWRNDDGTWPE